MPTRPALHAQILGKTQRAVHMLAHKPVERTIGQNREEQNRRKHDSADKTVPVCIPDVLAVLLGCPRKLHSPNHKPTHDNQNEIQKRKPQRAIVEHLKGRQANQHTRACRANRAEIQTRQTKPCIELSHKRRQIRSSTSGHRAHDLQRHKRHHHIVHTNVIQEPDRPNKGPHKHKQDDPKRNEHHRASNRVQITRRTQRTICKVPIRALRAKITFIPPRTQRIFGSKAGLHRIALGHIPGKLSRIPVASLGPHSVSSRADRALGTVAAFEPRAKLARARTVVRVELGILDHRARRRRIGALNNLKINIPRAVQ
eukprot:comp18294_c0_seq1/m.32458 comp18294_c0_seq1/g.32458  ORF comp18294_c0_seq1/g.32458 comp18294_c0_seq1/m.32458 type:complete len:313 (+) comp18294_c0_seq1:589-1527(+)